MSLDTCVRSLMEYFEYLTEQLLKKKDPERRPVVAEPPLVNLIVNVQKGNFAITAHTGAGKTTLGLLLYHKARLDELADYNVIYVNARELKNLLGPRRFDTGMLEAMFREESQIGTQARNAGVIFSSISGLNIECATPLECIKRIHEQNTKLILVIDELERAVEGETAINFIVDWFIATRRYYDETFAVPVKVVVTLPKVMSLIRTLNDHIRLRGGEAVLVFTEFRELAVTSEVIRDYFARLNEALSGVLKDLEGDSKFKELIEVLGHMVSGRFSIPILRRAIALSMCRSLGRSSSSNDIETEGEI